MDNELIIIMGELGINDFHVLTNTNKSCTLFINKNTNKDDLIKKLNNIKEKYNFSNIEFSKTNMTNTYEIAVELGQNLRDIDKRATNFETYIPVADIIFN